MQSEQMPEIIFSVHMHTIINVHNSPSKSFKTQLDTTLGELNIEECV